MNKNPKLEFLRFIENCESLYGCELRIKEAISTNGLNFNRHFTTHCESVFILLHCSWRLSGGRVLFAGATSSYEIGGDQLTGFTRHSATQFECVERYSETVFRQSNILVVC